MNGKLLLIDGHSMLNRAFYGIPMLTAPDGRHTNAVYGFLNILFHVLEEEQPQYLAVAFDLHAPTFRHKMYEAYKGTRKPMPEELREQVPMMKEMLCRMEIPIMTLEGYEADDLIGTVSRQAEESGMDVTILSGDRDLLQLSSDRVLVRLPKTKGGKTEVENYYPKDVLEKYGVTPLQIIDLKALMGDASDNIPGIPGVGEKTAAKIIAQFGSVEEAYAHVKEITPNRARISLEEHYDLAQLSKTLAAIDRHAPFVLDFEQARQKNIYTASALEMCRSLGFRNMLQRFESNAAVSAPDQEKMPFLAVFTEKEAADAAKAMLECWKERKKNDPEIKLSVGISLPGGASEDGVCAVFCEDAPSFGMVISENGELTRQKAGEVLRSLLGFADQICACGLKQQLDLLEGIDEERFEDASIAAYLLNPLQGYYPYDQIASEYASVPMPAKEELIGKSSGKNETSAEEKERKEKKTLLAVYEARSAFLSMPELMRRLQETEMLSLYRDIEMPLVFTLYRMEKAGIAVRSEELKDYGSRLAVQIKELEQRIYEQAGEEFNINSPKQLGVILFEKLDLPYGKKTKSGYSTAADALEKLSGEYPIVSDILEYRQLSKLKSTYADGLSAFISEDGRIHGKFHQTITATGRISSADPNLQNIPVRTQLGRELRKVFVPAPGCLFLDADYSQIELRVLAHMSGDDKLIEAYRQAQDIHAITASQVFHIPLDEVTPLERRNAKAVNFGIVYGISSFGLSQDLSISRKEAQNYIEQYFLTYPGIKRYLDGAVASAKEKGYAVTLFGRRRPMPELKSSNFMQRSFGERVAMNAPIQGSAADIIKIAMIRTDKRLREECRQARLILQVHDELLVETVPEELEKAAGILREEMMGAADLAVELEIDLHSGSSWYEAK